MGGENMAYSTGLCDYFPDRPRRTPAAIRPPRPASCGHRVPVEHISARGKRSTAAGDTRPGDRRHIDDPVRGAQLPGRPIRRIQRPHGVDRSRDDVAAEDPRPQRRLRLSRNRGGERQQFGEAARGQAQHDGGRAGEPCTFAAACWAWRARSRSPPKEKDVPSALKEIKPKEAKPDPSKYKSKIDPKLVREAEGGGTPGSRKTSRSRWTITTCTTCTRWNATRALPNTATRTRRRTRNGTATWPSS